MEDIGGTEKIEKIDIILVTYQRFRLLKIAITAIKLRTEYPHRLIVVDSGSTDGTREWLGEAKAGGLVDRIIFMEKNLGLGAAFQEGFKLVKSEYFVTTQDDLIPPKMNPCWLTQELAIARENPEYGGLAMKGARISRFDKLDDELK